MKDAARVKRNWMVLAIAIGLCVGSVVPARADDAERAAPRVETIREALRARHPHPCRERVLAEAKEALGAILTAEQVNYQRAMRYVAVAAADTAKLRELGLVLDEPSRRWSFEVRDVTETSFVAIARGRRHTRADGVVVTMSYTLRGNPVFDVEGCWARGRR